VESTFEHILSNRAWPDDRPALMGRSTATAWGMLRERLTSFRLDAEGIRHRRVGLIFRPSAACLAALAAMDRLGCDTFLLDGRAGRDAGVRLGQEFGLGALLTEVDGAGGTTVQVIPLPGEEQWSGQSTITILTSGSTGRPKTVRHTWESLCRPVRVHPTALVPRWLLTYRPHLYAGLQVLLQCLVNGGTLIVPEADASPQEVAELMRTAQATAASATPSYWRRLLLFADIDLLRAIPLVQITLGGEVVDQAILDALQRTFPHARIAHIYATTELGRCFSVTDVRAGFPARFLRGPTPDGALLWLEDGELVVRSANMMQVPAGGGATFGNKGHRTGDLVEIVGDRAFFVGRRTDMINVGGNKVFPFEVERVIRVVPGVADVRVYGRRSSIAGELVACEVIASEGVQRSALREAIIAVCRAELADFQRPRLIEFVPAIALEDSGKTSRRLEE